MNINRPDMTEDVKSKDYTNKSCKKDSNPVTMKASKSPATESSDQTSSQARTSCFGGGNRPWRFLPVRRTTCTNTTKDFRVLRIGTSIRVNKQSFDSWFAAV